jgi:hypothetical protein
MRSYWRLAYLEEDEGAFASRFVGEKRTQGNWIGLDVRERREEGENL